MFYDAKCLCSECLGKNKCGGVTTKFIVFASVSKKKRKKSKQKRKKKEKKKKKFVLSYFEFNKCVRGVVIRNEFSILLVLIY